MQGLVMEPRSITNVMNAGLDTLRAGLHVESRQSASPVPELARHRLAFLNAHSAILPRREARLLKSLLRIIESVNDTLKGKLDVKRHGGRTKPSVIARVLQQLLTAAIRHPVTLSLIGYDHCRSVRIEHLSKTRMIWLYVPS
jgi:hypothetical protein